jgi:hypothetical protein
MTEAEWLAGDEPSQLWRWVRNKATWRKAHLFCTACARRVVSLALPREVNSLVNLVEQAADMNMDRFALGEPRMRVIEARERLGSDLHRSAAMAAVYAASIELHTSSLSVNSVFHEAAKATSDPDAEYAAQANLLRDIFGNPFRPVALDTSWLSSTVVALARGIYDDRAFDRMPILADALEDAGCDNEDVLNHSRGGGPHVRGCWVVDLVLNKG